MSCAHGRRTHADHPAQAFDVKPERRRASEASHLLQQLDGFEVGLFDFEEGHPIDDGVLLLHQSLQLAAPPRYFIQGSLAVH